jgi:hypothetical protein
MGKRGKKENCCRDKRGYGSYAMAKGALRRMLRVGYKRDKTETRELDIYPCPFCHLFHVGHQLNEKENKPVVKTNLHTTFKPTVIFDIDGTLADPTHRRHHVSGKKDWEAFFSELEGDAPIEPVFKLFHAMQKAGYYTVIVTGRPERYRFNTANWLMKHGISVFKLYMRKNDDLRQDSVIKSDILDQIIADGYSPFLVIDDRQSVVDMWRSRGLVCLQNTPMEEAPTAEEAQKLSEKQERLLDNLFPPPDVATIAGTAPFGPEGRL